MRRLLELWWAIGMVLAFRLDLGGVVASGLVAGHRVGG